MRCGGNVEGSLPSVMGFGFQFMPVLDRHTVIYRGEEFPIPARGGGLGGNCHRTSMRPPVSFNPDISAWPSFPVGWNPDIARGLRDGPVAANPDVFLSACPPTPVTRHPDIRRTRLRRCNFSLNRRSWRRRLHDYLFCGNASCQENRSPKNPSANWHRTPPGRYTSMVEG